MEIKKVYGRLTVVTKDRETAYKIRELYWSKDKTVVCNQLCNVFGKRSPNWRIVVYSIHKDDYERERAFLETEYDKIVQIIFTK